MMIWAAGMAYLPVRSLGRGGVAGRWSPWTCREEWEEVYSWLYSSDPALVMRGVGRVCAWKARGHVPMMVEMTADLCECRVNEKSRKRGGACFQALPLQYSMAITRFVNGIGDIAKDQLGIMGSLITCVDKYGIPSWIVTLRHCGTHENLPHQGALSAGAEFCLSWLRNNYWRPQRLSIGERMGGTRSRTATPPAESEPGEGGKRPDRKEGQNHIWRLTRGLCVSRDQLVSLLVHSHYSNLKEYLMQMQLLQFPAPIKYDLKVPASTDLDVLCCLHVAEGDMKVWQTHLRKAAHRSSSLKQRLVSALMCAVNDTTCEPRLRDFLCGWLELLFGSMQERLPVVQLLDDSMDSEVELKVSGFFPGELDWMELLKVAKLYPGYYSYAVMKVIMGHLSPLLSEGVVSRVLQLSSLVTSSSRLRQNTRSPYGQLHEDLNTLKTILEQKRSSMSGSEEGGTSGSGQKAGSGEGMAGGGGQGGVAPRWSMVEDMAGWLECPLGLCPGQQLSSDMLELEQPEDSLGGAGKEDSGLECSGLEDSMMQQDSAEPGPSTVAMVGIGDPAEDENPATSTLRLSVSQIESLKQQVRIL